MMKETVSKCFETLCRGERFYQIFSSRYHCTWSQLLNGVHDEVFRIGLKGHLLSTRYLWEVWAWNGRLTMDRSLWDKSSLRSQVILLMPVNAFANADLVRLRSSTTIISHVISDSFSLSNAIASCAASTTSAFNTYIKNVFPLLRLSRWNILMSIEREGCQLCDGRNC